MSETAVELASISRLNDDILTHIFMFNTYLDLNHIHIPSTTIRRTSHVYQRWRDLLLSSPLIWAASLDFADPKPWLEVVLTRAGNVPLTITLPSLSRAISSEREERISQLRDMRVTESFLDLQQYFGFSPSDEQLEVALSLIPRCRSLTISVYTREHSCLVADKVGASPAPRLEALYLSDYNKHGHHIFSQPIEDSSSYCPQLRQLNLQGYRTDFSLPLFQNLTTLAVSNRFGKHAVSMTVNQWLQILHRMQQLEELQLDHCAESESSDPQGNFTKSPSGPVSLPHLKNLVLQGLCAASHQILSQISFPASCAMDYYVFFNPVERRPPYFPFPDMILQIYEKVKAMLQFRKMTSLSLEIKTRVLKLTNTRHANNGETSFSLTLDMFKHVQKLLPELLQLISTDVDDLYFHWMPVGSTGLEQSIAQTMLAPFKQVTNLRLATQASFRAISGCHRETKSTSGSGDHLVLPKLSKLSLYKIHFDTPGFVEEIVSLLYHRSSWNAPVEHVLLRSCDGFVDSLLAELYLMAVEIDCDYDVEAARKVTRS